MKLNNIEFDGNNPPTELLDIVFNNQKNGMKVCELGVAEGNTTVLILPIIVKNNGHLYVLDWWCGNADVPDPNHPHGLNFDEAIIKSKKDFFLNRIKTIFNNNEEELKKYVTILDGDCTNTIHKIEDKSLDICYIDGDHSYEAVKRDIKNCLKKIKNGGMICGHDWSEGHHGVRRAVDECFGSYAKKKYVIPVIKDIMKYHLGVFDFNNNEKF